MANLLFLVRIIPLSPALSLFARAGTTCLVLKNGRIEAEGPLDALLPAR
jgi:hypothetical protein